MEKRFSSDAICAKKTALQHEVAQFLGEQLPIARVDGIDHLVGFLEEIGLDAVEGLLAIPGASSGRAQTGHDLDQTLEFLACLGI